MNILVTGANGQLGNEMRIVAKRSKDKYIFTDVIEVDGQETIILDISNLDAIRQMVKDFPVQDQHRDTLSTGSISPDACFL